jgi:hypothetical protein
LQVFWAFLIAPGYVMHDDDDDETGPEAGRKTAW